MLEEYHSIGGMTITEEITLPGFKSDVHAFGYQLANLSPVPHELNLQRYGFELIHPEICLSHIFPNGKYISMYPSIDKTIKSIKFAKYLESKGGEIMTSSSVAKILIKNGKAIGVTLADGKKILAKRAPTNRFDIFSRI